MRPSFRQPSLWIFVAVFIVGLTWPLYTNHAWEDYYITYRASKNPATGHGLTFTAGEKVHSFTSPLGVLLPALGSLLTANRSDDAALWAFRIMSLAAYAGAAVFLWSVARFLNWPRLATGLLVTLFALDAKIVDFTTNGMETGILMLFLGWAVYAALAAPRRQAVHLGVAWAGLMWTRPDSFVYIGALVVGAFLFCPPERNAGGRWKFIKTCFAGGMLAAALYLPWLIWAWGYYGTPIPNTITAKGLFHTPVTPISLLQYVWDFPRAVTVHFDMLSTTFMPPYSGNTGWPVGMLRLTYWIAVLCLPVWLIPGVKREARLASFVFCAGQFYLTSFVAFPVPWYLPTITFFALLTISGLVAQAADAVDMRLARQQRAARMAQIGVRVGAGALMAGSLSITVLAAHQLKRQQAIVEIGQRKAIGLWLKEHSTSPRDTVFLECLGYIGFYSDLKMLDFPGLSSPEVIAARKRTPNRNYPDSWPALILDLSPDWLVLRSYEADAIRRLNPDILGQFYSLAKVFDVRPRVAAIPFIMGRNYLMNDAYFEVYRCNAAIARRDRGVARVRFITVASLDSNEAWSGKAYESMGNIVANAPSKLTLKKPKGARWLSGAFGIFEGAYERPPDATDGADFQVFLSANASSPRREIFHRFLNPRDVVADRGRQPFLVQLPTDATGIIELVITNGPNKNDAYDWTYWSRLLFEFPNSD